MAHVFASAQQAFLGSVVKVETHVTRTHVVMVVNVHRLAAHSDAHVLHHSQELHVSSRINVLRIRMLNYSIFRSKNLKIELGFYFLKVV